MAEVFITADAFEETEALPRPIRAKLRTLFRRLEDWPNVSGAKPLTGDLAGHWRMRIEDYRIILRLEGERIIVERIGHRREVYDD